MSVDPRLCPLCGGDNACARESGPEASVCWCQRVEFGDALLSRVPEAARRKACICARCCAGVRPAEVDVVNRPATALQPPSGNKKPAEAGSN